MKVSKMRALVIAFSAMIINPIAWADTSAPPTSATTVVNQKKSQIDNKIKSKVDSIPHLINTILSEHRESSKAAPARDLGWYKNGVLVVVASTLIYKGDLNILLNTIPLTPIKTIHLIGIDGQYMDRVEADSAQYTLLKTAIKKAAHPYLPHIYLTGTVKPEYVNDIIKLTSETNAIYEPAKTPVNLIVSSINKYISPHHRINISTISLSEVSTKSARLNNAIMQALPHINFMNANENYIHIQHDGNTLKVYHFDKRTHKTELREVIPVTHFSNAQMISVIHHVIKNYREGKMHDDKKHDNIIDSKNNTEKKQDNTNETEKLENQGTMYHFDRRR